MKVVQEFSITHPLPVAIGVVSGLLGSWFFDSTIQIVLAAAVGFFVGSLLEQRNSD